MHLPIRVEGASPARITREPVPATTIGKVSLRARFVVVAAGKETKELPTLTDVLEDVAAGQDLQKDALRGAGKRIGIRHVVPRPAPAAGDPTRLDDTGAIAIDMEGPPTEGFRRDLGFGRAGAEDRRKGDGREAARRACSWVAGMQVALVHGGTTEKHRLAASGPSSGEPTLKLARISGRPCGAPKPVLCHARPNTTSIPRNTRSSFAAGSFATRSTKTERSSATSCETFATDSFGSPESRGLRGTFPGALAHLTLLVSGTQTTVAIALRLNASP